MKSYLTRTSLLAITLILITVSSIGADDLVADGGVLLPSFTVDVTQGQVGTGFMVNCTNTTADLDPGCTESITYTWSMNNGVQGVDWDFLSNTNANSTDVIIDFITAGCDDNQLNAHEDNTSKGAINGNLNYPRSLHGVDSDLVPFSNNSLSLSKVNDFFPAVDIILVNQNAGETSDLVYTMSQNNNDSEIFSSEIVSNTGSYNLEGLNIGDYIGTSTLFLELYSGAVNITSELKVESINNGIYHVFAYVTASTSPVYLVGEIAGGFVMSNNETGISIYTLVPEDEDLITEAYEISLTFENLFVNPWPGSVTFTSTLISENDEVDIQDFMFDVHCPEDLNPDGAIILPSFTVDATQGQVDTGFVVQCTNTTSSFIPDCSPTLTYNWSVNNGVPGIDWDFIPGSNANSNDVNIGFITAGCYEIQLSVIGEDTLIESSPTTIIATEVPEINITNATSLDFCGGNSVEIEWEIASNNNQSVEVEILIDGMSVSNTTYAPTSICLPIGNVDISDTFNANTLSIGPHTFELIATSGFNSSSSSQSVNFEVFDNPTFTINGNTEICEDECIDLQVNWIDPPTSPVNLDWTIDTSASSSGESFNYCPTYTSGTAVIGLIVTGINTCSSSAAISVTTTPIPITSITVSEIEGCSPLIVDFQAEVDFAAITAWDFGNGQNDSEDLSPQMIFDCEDYNSGDCLFDVNFAAISASNPNCFSTNSETITIHPQPLADFNLSSEGTCFDVGSDADIIINNTSSNITGLNCSGGVEPYAWTVFPTGVTDCTELLTDVPNLFAAGTGVFTIGLVATDVFGCNSQTFKDFNVFSNPIPEITFLQNTICLPLEVEILNTSTGASTFNLEIPGFVIPENFSSPFVIEAEFPGVYEAELTITSDEGCTVVLEIDNAFQAWYPPVADFLVTPEEIIFLDPIVTFENMSVGGTEYIWSFGDGTGSSEVSPEHEYDRADSYEVQLHVTNIHGCTDIATQTIYVTNELQLFVPNAFTPNNDGNNDSWSPVINGEELILSYECWVYDRWGKLVFNSTTVGEPWIGDNTVDGVGTHYVSATEQFSWKIEVKKVDGRGANISTGTVFLVR